MLNKLREIKRVLVSNSTNKTKPNNETFSCPVCNSSNITIDPLALFYFFEMQKYGFVHNIFMTETINLKNYTCSICGAADRDRLYALYLHPYFKSKKSLNLLDIAPANALKNFIKSYPNVSYRSMDLYMDGVDDKVDITNMTVYKNEQFDTFICSHVLEHIPDDLLAMRELYRILKPGGKGIVMVPINLGIEKTLEDPLCDNIPTRWKYFGQDDHIRAYSKNDFISRLQAAGFEVALLDIDYFGEEVFIRNAIFPSSVLYIVSK